jgi:hypothetical protein
MACSCLVQALVSGICLIFGKKKWYKHQKNDFIIGIDTVNVNNLVTALIIQYFPCLNVYLPFYCKVTTKLFQ